MEGQDKFIMWKPDNADVGVREDCEEDLVDVGCNADLYIVVNQESTDLTREVHMGDALFALLMGQGQQVKTPPPTSYSYSLQYFMRAILLLTYEISSLFFLDFT